MDIQPLGTSSGSMFLFHAWCICSPRARGTMFWWKQKRLIMHVLKQNSALWFYAHFLWFYTCTKPLGRDREPIRAKIFISTGSMTHLPSYECFRCSWRISFLIFIWLHCSWCCAVGGRKTSPRTSTIVHFIFYFDPLRSAVIFWEIRNKWLV